MTTIDAQLTVEHVTRRYETAILDDASLTASPGDTIAIVGPSGSGKSTLLNIIGSLDKPTSGSVRLGNVEVTTLAGDALARYRAERVGFVFQDHHLLPQLTALENVLLPTVAAHRRGQESAARALLERVGVAHRADAFPAQLSGGERQRVAIARALINGAGLLLCDEPTGNLDHETGAHIIDLLLDLATSQRVIVLMVTHNAEHAARFSRCLAIERGRLVPAPAEVGGAR